MQTITYLESIASNNVEAIPFDFRDRPLEFVAYAEQHLSEPDRAGTPAKSVWLTAINNAARTLPLDHNEARTAIKTVASERLGNPSILSHHLRRVSAAAKLEEAKLESQESFAAEENERRKLHYSGQAQKNSQHLKETWERDWDSEIAAAGQDVIKRLAKQDRNARDEGWIKHQVDTIARLKIMRDLAPVALGKTISN